MTKPHPILGPPPRDMDEVVQRLLKLEAAIGPVAPPGLAGAIRVVERSLSTFGAHPTPEAISILLDAGRELLRITTPTSEVPTGGVGAQQGSSSSEAG